MKRLLYFGIVSATLVGVLQLLRRKCWDMSIATMGAMSAIDDAKITELRARLALVESKLDGAQLGWEEPLNKHHEETGAGWWRGRKFCFDGSAYSETRLPIGAHGLVEFEVNFDFKAKGCSKTWPFYNRSKQFHSGGCSLVSAMRGSRRNRKAWWIERREAPALPPRESLEQPRSMSQADQLRRTFIEEALAKGSRSDWGVSLTPDGRLMFGIGHRDFGEASQTAGLKRSSARPVRDMTIVTEGGGWADGQWHHVVVKRRRRTARATNSQWQYNAHDTSDLLISIDGEFRSSSAFVTGGRPSDSAAGQAALDSGGSPGYGGSAPPHPLFDATYHVTLGELLVGCIAAFQIGPPQPFSSRAYDKRIPLYYYAHGDNESIAMRDAFIGSLVDRRQFELREMRAGDTLEPQSERFSTKIKLVLKAVNENPQGTLVVISDMDLRFFKPVAQYIREYAAHTVDAVFQRDEDRSLQVNLGFMALVCSKPIAQLFAITGEIIHRKRSGATGDQRIVNRALAQPWYYGTPRLRWSVFPTEIATNTVAHSLRTDNMYGANVNDYVLFHANDYGRASLGAERARSAKMKLLDDVSLMIANDQRAPPTTKRWPGRGLYKRPEGDLP